MEKIMKDKSFWIILIVSVISLIFLTIGVIYFTSKNTKTFYSAGYIINSNVTKADKYYFDDKTEYKENIFSEYVFKDTDNKKVKADKNNFIHYLDNSLSFMKNGVILDLDNFKENMAPYYNITNKSIIKYNNGGYYIENQDKTLVFGNFLGRINDNKYIVVGNDIKIKLSGNEEQVKGNYFEILFVEKGIVKIVNQEGNYQTVADGSIIYVGDKIKINLGDKEVSYDDNVKLSLSELTIDGNENIDIKPDKDDGLVDKENEDKDESGLNGSSGNGDGSGTGTGNGEGNGESSSDGDGDEDKTILKKETSVNLVEASSDVNTIKTKFQVIDTANILNGNIVLTLVNTDTGKTVYKKILANTPEEQYVVISSLVSDSNYLMTINLENNDKVTQYFQKSFRTSSLNLKLKRELVTEKSLSYSLDFGNDTDAVAADITLYDSENKKVNSYTLRKEDDSKVIFDGLSNNTLYRAVVSNVVLKNIQYDELYKTETSDFTLKNKPEIGNISVSKNDESKNFTLKIDDVKDDDKSIVKYTYKIYKSEELTKETMNTVKPIYEFSRNKLDDEILKLDEAKNLYGNTDYKFKVSVLYFDNYRYNEIESIYSESFNIIGKPSIKFEEDVVDFNRISGKVLITDVDCTIPFEGRECNNKLNNFSIVYSGGKSKNEEIKEIVIDPVNLTLSFDLKGLIENTLYSFEVFADVDLMNGTGLHKGQHIGGFNVNTKAISPFSMEYWNKGNDYSFNKPISVNTKLSNVKTESNNNEDNIDKVSSIKFNLYKGDTKNSLAVSTPIASFSLNGDEIKDKLFNNEFNVNTLLFEFINSETEEKNFINDLKVLKDLSGGKVERYYTIEVADCFDETGTNEFFILDNVYVYEIPSILLLEEEVLPPEILVDPITNIQTKVIKDNPMFEKNKIVYDKNLGDDIVRGYKVTSVFDKTKIENYFVGSNPINKINFYVNDSKGNMIESSSIDLTKEDTYTTYFFLENGTKYDVIDDKLRRGNSYKFSFNLSIDDDNDVKTPEVLFPTKVVESELLSSLKQAPLFKYFIDTSSDTSITYKYKLVDIDNALCSEEDGKFYLYYDKGNEEVYKTEIVLDGSQTTFVLDNLSNTDIYTLKYNSALIKDNKPALVTLQKYYFDGYYDLTNKLSFELDYGNFDNRLKIIIKDNELLDRVSAYLLTIKSNNDKYEKVISKLDSCDIEGSEEKNKCIIVDYKDISKFKGKDLVVNIDAFYDTGYIGFSQKSKLDDYFKSIGLIDKNNKYKSGFVFQTVGNDNKGLYFDIRNSAFNPPMNTPNGILDFEFVFDDNLDSFWKINTSNLVDKKNNKFVKHGDISHNDISLMLINDKVIIYTGNSEEAMVSLNPKVLDKTKLNTNYDKFKFTSIIPKVTSKTKPFINGTEFNINLSIDPKELDTDFIKNNGKYKFYIDIFDAKSCEEGECVKVKTIETDYDNLSKVVTEGLAPDTLYMYKIAADMNVNGKAKRTYLFDYNKQGYVEYKNTFKTFDKTDIFSRVIYDYNSYYDDIKYDNRKLNFSTFLKNKINFDIKYKLIDINEKVVLEKQILNKDISEKNIASLSYILPDDFVFGPDYYTLVITAVTTDLKLELELYNKKVISSSPGDGMLFHELRKPEYGFEQTADIVENKGEYDYGLSFIMTITDKDKVIKNGRFPVELTDLTDKSACPGRENECKFDVDILNGTCISKSGSTKNCQVIGRNKDKISVKFKFNKLLPDTNYKFSSPVGIHRNNYKNSLIDETLKISQFQFTNSKLNFSLGAVTPTAVSKNKIVITFTGAANLEEYIKGIDYTVTVGGGEKIASDSLGKTDTTNKEFTFSHDKDGYPTITIPIVGDKELGNNNFIIITYYYLNEKGQLVKLNVNGNTTYQYTVGSKDK